MVTELRKYRKNAKSRVVAIQLDLETNGFTYRKWGALQKCNAGDWLVLNGDDLYTVAKRTFASTYSPLGNGLYEKVTPVWATITDSPGFIETKEGKTHYEAGWYLVYNDETKLDGYAISPTRFEKMYHLETS